MESKYMVNLHTLSGGWHCTDTTFIVLRVIMVTEDRRVLHSTAYNSRQWISFQHPADIRQLWIVKEDMASSRKKLPLSNAASLSSHPASIIFILLFSPIFSLSSSLPFSFYKGCVRTEIDVLKWPLHIYIIFFWLAGSSLWLVASLVVLRGL